MTVRNRVMLGLVVGLLIAGSAGALGDVAVAGGEALSLDALMATRSHCVPTGPVEWVICQVLDIVEWAMEKLGL